MSIFSAASLSLLWIPYVERLGIPSSVAYIGLPCILLTITIATGYYDQRSIWKHENDIAAESSNPYHEHWIKLFNDVEEIKKRLN